MIISLLSKKDSYPEIVVQLLQMKSLTKELLLVGHFIKLVTKTNKPQKQKQMAPS